MQAFGLLSKTAPYAFFVREITDKEKHDMEEEEAAFHHLEKDGDKTTLNTSNNLVDTEEASLMSASMDYDNNSGTDEHGRVKGEKKHLFNVRNKFRIPVSVIT